MAKVHDIIKENRRRLDRMFEPYDPIKGIGSPIERFELVIEAGTSIYLPVAMQDDKVIASCIAKGSVVKFIGDNWPDQPEDQQLEIFNQTLSYIVKIRLKHDFEFWAATCATIMTKAGDLIKFRLNRPQRRLLQRLMMMMLAGIPMRVILLKARQWGGSTLIQLFMSWVQLEVKDNWNSAVIAQFDDQAKHIRGMYDRVLKEYPKEVGKYHFTPYQGSSKIKIITERGCILGVASYENPDALRSFTTQMVHFSEVGLYRETVGKSPESLAKAVRSAIPNKPLTLIAFESTANGPGNFFHREWQSAVNKESSYDPVFVPWFEIEEYTTDISDYETFVNGMNEYDHELWRLGATLEGIAWYNAKKSGDNYSDLDMNSEFPSTPEEAFAATGNMVFPKDYIANTRLYVRKPDFIGDLRGDKSIGRECVKNLEFHQILGADCHVWMPPDTTINVSNRYAVFVDIGGKNKHADYSVIRVIDRYPMLRGEAPEFVFTYRGHIDHDHLAWKAVQVATWYNNALLAIETNTVDKDKTEGNHFLTIIDTVADFYSNMYTRTNLELIRQGAAAKWGFHTNSSTKQMIIDRLVAASRDVEYVEYDERACNEMTTFENKPNGSTGAVEGTKDDMVITTAGCVWLALEYMDAPKLVTGEGKKKKQKAVGVSII